MNKIFKQGICALFSLCVRHAASAAESISVLHWWTSGGESNYVVAGEPQTHEAIACMLPKGDAALKAVVDRTIARLETNGRGQSLYNAWFMSPIVVLT